MKTFRLSVFLASTMLVAMNAFSADQAKNASVQDPGAKSAMATDEQKMKECLSEMQSSHAENMTDHQKMKKCKAKIEKIDSLDKGTKHR